MKNIIASQYLKRKLLYSLFMVAGFIMAANTFAATVSFSPASIGPREGQTVNLTVAVDPQGTKAYTVKLQIIYPKDLLEVQSFTFSGRWVALVQPGYDLIDNTNGILIKTAGYPGGLNAKADFGTIVFKAKKNGAGAVQVATSSVAFGANNQNMMSGLPIKASVVITEATPAQQQQKQEERKELKPTPTPTIQERKTLIEGVNPFQTPIPAPQLFPSVTPVPQTSLLASAAGSFGVKIAAGLAVIGAVVIAFLIMNKKKRKK